MTNDIDTITKTLEFRYSLGRIKEKSPGLYKLMFYYSAFCNTTMFEVIKEFPIDNSSNYQVRFFGPLWEVDDECTFNTYCLGKWLGKGKTGKILYKLYITKLDYKSDIEVRFCDYVRRVAHYITINLTPYQQIIDKKDNDKFNRYDYEHWELKGIKEHEHKYPDNIKRLKKFLEEVSEYILDIKKSSLDKKRLRYKIINHGILL